MTDETNFSRREFLRCLLTLPAASVALALSGCGAQTPTPPATRTLAAPTATPTPTLTAAPATANPLASIEHYDRVLLGSPIWSTRAPRIMMTFAEGLDFRAKTVFPFTTHAGSGLGGVVSDYTSQQLKYDWSNIL